MERGRLAGTAGFPDISDLTNQVLFHSQLKANREFSKNYSNILIEQQLLHLIYYYRLAFFLLFLSYTQKNLLVVVLLLFIL